MLDFAWVIEFSIFRVFELFDLCGLSELLFQHVFFGVGDRGRSGGEVVFELIYHSYLNGLLKIYWGIILGFGIGR